jgi:hypothetical protein
MTEVRKFLCVKHVAGITNLPQNNCRKLSQHIIPRWKLLLYDVGKSSREFEGV